MEEMILTTDNLSKTFKDNKAVDSVNLHIRKGSIYGLIGMNGAGKTTIMKMLTGMIKPTSGSFTYKGLGQTNKEAFSRIGALIEAPAIYSHLTAFDNLKLKCLAYGINDNNYIKEKLTQVGLADVGKKKAGRFSLGMKQRLGIALALVGEPDFLLLDEPINGLDPQGIVELRDLFLNLNKNYGVTILISSHILEELSKIATDYALISYGRIIEEISSEELMNKCRGKVQIKTKFTDKVVTVLDNNGFTNYSVVDAETIDVFERTNEVPEINMLIAREGILIDSIGSVDTGLEDYFLKVAAKGKPENAKSLNEESKKQDSVEDRYIGE